MASSHGTRLSLKPWPYRALKALAGREGVSIRDMLRQPSRARRGLAAVAGIGRDRKAAGRDHDRWLHGQGSRARGATGAPEGTSR